MMRIPLIFPLCMVALLSGCQQTRLNAQPGYQQPGAARQLSSVAAGTRYLRINVIASDLPLMKRYIRAAVNVPVSARMGNIDVATLSQNSDRLYQQLLQDGTRKPHSAVNLIVARAIWPPACAATKRSILSAGYWRALFLFRLLVNFSARPVLSAAVRSCR